MRYGGKAQQPKHGKKVQCAKCKQMIPGYAFSAHYLSCKGIKKR